MTYVGLGNRFKQGFIDAQNNSGNWTVSFAPSDLVTNVPEYECYHIALQGPASSTFQWFINGQFYDNVLRGDINSWNPPQPAILRPGDRLDFYWSVSTAPAPTMTIWLRFDPTAQADATQHFS